MIAKSVGVLVQHSIRSVRKAVVTTTTTTTIIVVVVPAIVIIQTVTTIAVAAFNTATKLPMGTDYHPHPTYRSGSIAQAAS